MDAGLERLKVISCWEDDRRNRVPVSRCHRDKRIGECVCSIGIQFKRVKIKNNDLFSSIAWGITILHWIFDVLVIIGNITDRTNAFANSFIPMTSRDRNSLPPTVFPTTYNLQSFKTSIHRYLSSTPTQSLNIFLFSRYKGPPRTTEIVTFSVVNMHCPLITNNKVIKIKKILNIKNK